MFEEGAKCHRLEVRDTLTDELQRSAASHSHPRERGAQQKLREGRVPWPAPVQKALEPDVISVLVSAGWVFHTSALSSTRGSRAHQRRHPREREPRAAGRVSLGRRPLSVHRRRAGERKERDSSQSWDCPRRTLLYRICSLFVQLYTVLYLLYITVYTGSTTQYRIIPIPLYT